MKSIILTIIIPLGILSCKSQTQRVAVDKIRSEIHAELDKNIAECNSNVDAITDFNRKKEFWQICKLENNIRIIQIESYVEAVYCQEIYFEKNGQLNYAKEMENYITKNHFIQLAWNCEFYAKNGKLISLMSLGHGKTEEDEWSPEIIFEMHNKSLIELKKIKKIMDKL